MMAYHCTLILNEEAKRLDWAVQHDHLEHAKSYIESIESLLADLKQAIK